MPEFGWNRDAHRAGFLEFLGFVRKNLAGQTALRVHASWATQAQVIAGFSQVVQPDHILRESQLAAGLGLIGREIDREVPPAPEIEPDMPFSLAEIHDGGVEAAVRRAYQRDFVQFGFGAWAEEPAA